MLVSLNSRRAALALSACTLAVLALNAWVFVHRQEGFLLESEPLSNFYALSDTPHIAGFTQPDRSHLTITLGGPNSTQFRFETRLSEGEQPWEPASVSGNPPNVRLLGGLREHRLIAENGNAPVLYFRSAAGRGRQPIIGALSWPLALEPQYELATFVLAPSAFESIERQKAQALLTELGVSAARSDREKIQLLGTYLVTELDSHRGWPTFDMRHQSPWTQYEWARSGRSEIYCANFANIYAFLANVAGIPTRIIDAHGERDGVQLTGHTFNESYLRDDNRWVYFDATLNVVFVEQADGTPADTAAVLHAHRSGSAGSITALRVTPSGEPSEAPQLDRVPLSDIDSSALFVHPAVALEYRLADPHPTSALSFVRRWAWSSKPVYSPRDLGHRALVRLSAFYLALFLLGLDAWLLVRWLTSRRKSRQA